MSIYIIHIVASYHIRAVPILPQFNNTGNVNDRVGQQEYTAVGTYSWICPTGVHHVSVVAVGAGGTNAGNGGAGGFDGSAGGGLGWKNNISVTPGQAYTVVVGAGGDGLSSGEGSGKWGSDSYFINSSTVKVLSSSCSSNDSKHPSVSLPYAPYSSPQEVSSTVLEHQRSYPKLSTSVPVD